MNKNSLWVYCWTFSDLRVYTLCLLTVAVFVYHCQTVSQSVCTMFANSCCFCVCWAYVAKQLTFSCELCLPRKTVDVFVYVDQTATAPVMVIKCVYYVWHELLSLCVLSLRRRTVSMCVYVCQTVTARVRDKYISVMVVKCVYCDLPAVDVCVWIGLTEPNSWCFCVCWSNSDSSFLLYNRT